MGIKHHVRALLQQQTWAKNVGAKSIGSPMSICFPASKCRGSFGPAGGLLDSRVVDGEESACGRLHSTLISGPARSMNDATA